MARLRFMIVAGAFPLFLKVSYGEDAGIKVGTLLFSMSFGTFEWAEKKYGVLRLAMLWVVPETACLPEMNEARRAVKLSEFTPTSKDLERLPTDSSEENYTNFWTAFCSVIQGVGLAFCIRFFWKIQILPVAPPHDVCRCSLFRAPILAHRRS